MDDDEYNLVDVNDEGDVELNLGDQDVAIMFRSNGEVCMLSAMPLHNMDELPFHAYIASLIFGRLEDAHSLRREIEMWSLDRNRDQAQSDFDKKMAHHSKKHLM